MNKKVVALLLTIALLIAVAYFFWSILLYFIIAIVFSFVLSPIVEFLTKSAGLPKGLSVVVSMVLFSLALLFFGSLFMPLVEDQVEKISRFDQEMISQNFYKSLDTIEAKLVSMKVISAEKDYLIGKADVIILDIIKKMTPAEYLDHLLSFTGSLLVGIIAVVFITFFLLYQKKIVSKSILYYVPNEYFELTINAFYKINTLLSNYLLGLLVQMLAIFTLTASLLGFLNVEYAITIGVFAAIANLVPYLGPMLGTIFGVIVATFSIGFDMDYEVYIMFIGEIIAVFGVVQLSDNLLFQPIIFSKSVKAHPLEIFVVIFVAATIGGATGMIMAIPGYTVLRVSIVELYRGLTSYKIFKTD